jgi:hypothetical protein
MLSRREKWNFRPRVEHELDAYKGLLWTRPRTNSHLEQCKALAYDTLREARFKFLLCPECNRPFVPVRRQGYCSSHALRRFVLASGARRILRRTARSGVSNRKVSGRQIGAVQARGDQGCETRSGSPSKMIRRLQSRPGAHSQPPSSSPGLFWKPVLV